MRIGYLRVGPSDVRKDCRLQGSDSEISPSEISLSDLNIDSELIDRSDIIVYYGSHTAVILKNSYGELQFDSVDRIHQYVLKCLH